MAKGYEDKTGHKVVSITYYGQRMLTANREIKKPEDMKGMKLRVPPAPLYLMFPKAVGANATPIAFAEVYLALQQGTIDGQENPLPTIMAKKFYEVQSHIMLTAHITDSLLTIVGGHVWSQLTDDEKKIFNEVLMEAASKATEAIEPLSKLVDEFASWARRSSGGSGSIYLQRSPFITTRMRSRLDERAVKRSCAE